MGGVETPRSLAFDYHDLGRLGRPHGKILWPGVESTWNLRRHQALDDGDCHGQGSPHGSIVFLVLGHQHHGSSPWTYRPQHPRHLGHPWDITIRSSHRCCPLWVSLNLDLKALFDTWVVETLSRSGQEPSKEEVQKLHKNFFNYSTLIIHFASRGEERPCSGEHEAFLFYWYNKFICCTKSIKCLVENMPVVEALTSGHVLTLSPDHPQDRPTPEWTSLGVSTVAADLLHLASTWKFLTFSIPRRSVFNWPPDRCLLIRLRKSSGTSLVWKTSPTTSSSSVVVVIIRPPLVF